MTHAQSLRADHVTPDIIGKKVLVDTLAGATLMGVVTGYQIDAKRSEIRTFLHGDVFPAVTALYLNLEGIENTVTVRGEAEVKVLA